MLNFNLLNFMAKNTYLNAFTENNFKNHKKCGKYKQKFLVLI